MASGNGIEPPESAEKSIGEVVGDISQKAALLVREEIDLAKAEVGEKVSKLAKGAVVAVVAGVFAVLALVYLLHALAWLFVDLLELDRSIWIGYLIVTGLLLLAGAIAGLVALRLLKRGTPPTPQLAIEEARKTRIAIEDSRR